MSQSRDLSRFSFPRFLRNDAILLGPVAMRPDADEDFLGTGRLASEPGSLSESSIGGPNPTVRSLGLDRKEEEME